MPINLLDDAVSKPVNLLEGFADEQETGDPVDIARKRIQKKYPRMPGFLREMMISAVGTQPHPHLKAVSEDLSSLGDYVPVAAGGLLQGASLPIRGVAGLIPTEFTQKLANSPDLTTLFPQPETTGQEAIQLIGELAGGGGLYGKLFQGAKAASGAARVPQMLQNPLALTATGAVGTPGDVKDRGLGAGAALALGGAGKAASRLSKKVSDNLPAFWRGITTDANPKDLVKAVQQPHDILESTADELYGQVRGAIKNRGIEIPIKDQHLEEIAKVLPKTRASAKLIEKAKTGDYNAVHKLQSHLYKKGTKGLASDDIALENQGEEILDLRDKINDDLENHLITNGHVDIAHVLRQGKRAYADLMNTYYPKNLRKGIGKMVHSDLRLVPENPEDLFHQDSVPMRDFLTKHPEVGRHALGIREKKEANKLMKKMAYGGAGSGAAFTGLKSIYDLFK